MLFLALGAIGLSFTGLFVLFGIHAVISPGPVYPEQNRKEGAGVLCVILVPFAFCAFLMRRGFVHWRSARDFDRLITFIASQENPNLRDAATTLSLELERLQQLATFGVTKGFITEPELPELSLSGASVAGFADAPGRSALLATLSAHGYGVGAAVMLALEKVVGRDLILLVCIGGIPLMFVLHTLGIAGGVSGIRAVKPPSSRRRAYAAVVLGVLGYLALLLLAFATALELSFGPR